MSTHLAAAEASPELLALERECLPILEAGWLPGAEGALPVVVLNVAGRPDVADLFRVHRLEPEPGYAMAAWTFRIERGSLWCFLNVRMERPARCAFRLGLHPDEHAALLAAIAGTGHLAVACSGCEDVLVLRVPTGDLRDMLGVLARHRAVRATL